MKLKIVYVIMCLEIFVACNNSASIQASNDSAKTSNKKQDSSLCKAPSRAAMMKRNHDTTATTSK